MHLTRVTPCPSEFPAGYYWYGGKRQGPGRLPKWVKRMLSNNPQISEENCDNLDPTNGVCEEREVDDHPSTNDTLSSESNDSITPEFEDMVPDPRRTRTPYGLRDHLVVPPSI